MSAGSNGVTSTGSTGENVGHPVRLEPQAHGGALSRSGRKPGSRNRSKPVAERVRALAGRKSVGAVKKLLEIAEDPLTPPAVAVRALALILAYGAGPPVAPPEAPAREAEAIAVTRQILGLDL